MDGYSLINRMLKVRRRYRLTATEQALYYELINICNGEDWPAVFNCSNEELYLCLNISENTLVKARQSLIDAGLIFFKSGKSRRTVCQYSFINPFETVEETTAGTTEQTTAGTTSNFEVESSAESSDLYIGKTKTETKTKKKFQEETEKNKPKGYEKFSFDFVEPEFRDCFLEWLEYKRMRGEKYRTQKTLQLCYNQLKQKAGFDSMVAVKIVENSMANNWAGLFELKNNNNGNGKQQHPFAKKITGKEFKDF